MSVLGHVTVQIEVVLFFPKTHLLGVPLSPTKKPSHTDQTAHLGLTLPHTAARDPWPQTGLTKARAEHSPAAPPWGPVISGGLDTGIGENPLGCPSWRNVVSHLLEVGHKERVPWQEER